MNLLLRGYTQRGCVPQTVRLFGAFLTFWVKRSFSQSPSKSVQSVKSVVAIFLSMLMAGDFCQ
jgi:hypothetical protein